MLDPEIEARELRMVVKVYEKLAHDEHSRYSKEYKLLLRNLSISVLEGEITTLEEYYSHLDWLKSSFGSTLWPSSR